MKQLLLICVSEIETCLHNNVTFSESVHWLLLVVWRSNGPFRAILTVFSKIEWFVDGDLQEQNVIPMTKTSWLANN